jgi:Eukaryotic cytochrome b561
MACTVSRLPSDYAKAAHAVLMTIAWGILLPVSVIFARLYRHKTPRVGENAWWYRKHKLYGYLGVALTVAGFGCGVYMKMGSTHFNSVHSKTGLAVVALAVLQGTVGLAGSKHVISRSSKVVWLCHKILGYGGIVLAMVTIFLGLRAFGIPVPNLVSVGYSVCCVILGTLFLFKQGIATRAKKRDSQLRIAVAGSKQLLSPGSVPGFLETSPSTTAINAQPSDGNRNGILGQVSLLATLPAEDRITSKRRGRSRTKANQVRTNRRGQRNDSTLQVHLGSGKVPVSQVSLFGFDKSDLLSTCCSFTD